MIQKALQYLIELGNVKEMLIGGQTYSTQEIHQVYESTPNALQVRNLSGLIDYLKSDYDTQPSVLVHVASPTEVNVYSTFNRDYARNHLLQAKALLPDIPFKNFLDIESFNILLQSCFVSNTDRDALLAVVGTVQDEHVMQFGDDGVSQQVSAKNGVASYGNVKVPNPVKLKPFRTFVEIEQPESQFVFRMQKGPSAALFEADGGKWKLDAIEGIKIHLNATLQEQISKELVTVIG